MSQQNVKNHARIDPVFHYVLAPIFLANCIVSLVRLYHHRYLNAWVYVWAVVIALALLLLTFLVRTYSLKVQDRVIRLEERIRMAALLPMDSRPLQNELTTRQIIALRFASDAELASLTERTVRENLTPKAIKQQIQQWRPDNHRV